MIYFDQILRTYTFHHRRDTGGINKGYKVLPSISLADGGQILIILKPHGIF